MVIFFQLKKSENMFKIYSTPKPLFGAYFHKQEKYLIDRNSHGKEQGHQFQMEFSATTHILIVALPK